MCQPIKSVKDFVERVRDDHKTWNTRTHPWFRGEPSRAAKEGTELLPKLYRLKNQDGTFYYDENKLLQFFRMKSRSHQFGYTPLREHTDEWLFLAQHVGLPTRLLDWTEGGLIALYFALTEEQEAKKEERGNPVVWMLDPIELNRLALWDSWRSGGFPPEMTDYVKDAPKSTLVDELEDFKTKEFTKNEDRYKDFPSENRFGLTWHKPEDGSVNVANINIRGAWEKDAVGSEFPVAIHPTNIHPRMSVQRSCFTIHGKNKKALNVLLEEVGFKYRKKYVIDDSESDGLLWHLRMLGISQATLFPDLDGLAKDLETRF